MKPTAATCPQCGLTYAAFRTGHTFQEVKDSFWTSDPDPSTWKYSRRNAVLGRWHQWKLNLWADHIEQCTPLALESEKEGERVLY